jgi:hypothetical protein
LSPSARLTACPSVIPDVFDSMVRVDVQVALRL